MLNKRRYSTIAVILLGALLPGMVIASPAVAAVSVSKAEVDGSELRRYTLDLLPALKAAAVPTRLIWGRDDDFQKVSFARRYIAEVPGSDLVEVAGKHIPMEDSPHDIAKAMLAHLLGRGGA